MTPLALRELSARDVRNLVALDLAPCARFNVIHGENGQGKTNTLEAIYLVATSRSFRTARMAEVVRVGAARASVRASVDEGGVRRVQSVGLEGSRRLLRVDGQRPRSAALYASRTPVVVFSPSSLALTMGTSAERRTLLDRVSLFDDPASVDRLAAYHRAVRERQRAMVERGTSARDLDDWELLVVRHGLEVVEARARAAREVVREAALVFRDIAPGLSLAGRYAMTAPGEAAAYRASLLRDRVRDVRRRSASIGPHRDDLVLEVSGLPARTTASQGQHRLLVLALKAAELRVIARLRSVEPVLLLDDVSSELDAARTAAFFDYLESQQGQVFLTTTRPGLIVLEKGGLEDRRDFRIVGGRTEA